MRRISRSFRLKAESWIPRHGKACKPEFKIGAVLLAMIFCSTSAIAFIGMKPAAPAISNGMQHDSIGLLETAQLQIARRGHTATALADGRILVIGGENESGAVSETEFFDPLSHWFALNSRLLEGRANHTAVLLGDGRVLVAGGRSGNHPLDSTEIYSPAANSFSPGPRLMHPRYGHTGIVLSNGAYMLIGGDDGGTAEIFDLETQSFILLSSHPATARFFPSAALLQNSKVLITGGVDRDGQPLSTADLFDPSSLTFSPVSSAMQVARIRPNLHILPDGKVQIIGGDDEMTMEMFNPEREYFTACAHLITESDDVERLLRSPARTAMIHLIGSSVDGGVSSSGGANHQLQGAVSEAPTEAASVTEKLINRTCYSITALPNSNQVLIAGGATASYAATASAVLLAGSGSATVTTDLTDYIPGNLVAITGTGWKPGETVQLMLRVDPKTSEDTLLTPSVADENGAFKNYSFVVRESDRNVTFTLTATGQSSGYVAMTNFTDIGGPGLDLVKTASPLTYSIVEQSITYTYRITNLSTTVTVTGPIKVADDHIGSPNNTPFTCSEASLAPRASATCTHTYLITETDLNNRSVTNHASASNGTITSATATATINASLTIALSLTKSASPATYSSPGSVITYTYVIKNTGTGSASGPFTISDDHLGAPLGTAFSCGSGPLAANATTSCTEIYTITQADLDSGSVKNTATASGNGVTSQPASATVNALQNKVLRLAKTADPGSPGKPGDLINYTLTAKNEGNVTLGNVSISDPPVATLTCTPAQPATLAPGQSLVCTGSYALTQVDIDAGKVDNTATANSGQTSPATTTNSVTVPQTPALSLAKSASPTTFDSINTIINYSYVITNSGNVTLQGPFSVSDNKAAVTCPSIASLLPGASITCSASHTTLQADLDAGFITNHAEATNGTVTSNQDQATVNAIVRPGFSLSKSASPAAYTKVGDVINYAYELKNTGNITLNGPFTVSDDRIGTPVNTPFSCSGNQLLPNATVTCSATYNITQADLDAGSVTNHAVAANAKFTSNQAQATVTADAKPQLTLSKNASPMSYSSTGAIITYTLTAANSGNVTLSSVVISDAKLSALNCTQPASLAPGGALTCTGAYSTTQADLDLGKVSNTANAGGVYNATPVAANPASVTVNAVWTPHLTLTKTAAQKTYNNAGDLINYTLVAGNDGNVNLSAVNVFDAKLGAISCSWPLTQGVLSPGQSVSCSGTYTITQADMDAGSVQNIANAGGKFGTTPVNAAPADVIVTAQQNPHLLLQKTSSIAGYSKSGDVIRYTLAATNDGNVTLSSVSISDQKLGTLNCTQPIQMIPGAQLTCTGSYATTQADLDTGSVTNTAAATGTFGARQVNATDSVTVHANQNTQLTLTKTAAESIYSRVGDIIHYTMAATNNGNVNLSNVSISDSMPLNSFGCAPAPPAVLAPGQAISCTGSHTIIQADLDAGSIMNTATADGVFGAKTVSADPASVTVNAVQNAHLTLTKTASPMVYGSIGTVIGYTLIAKNDGNVTLTNIVISDPMLGMLSCAQPVSLAPGVTHACTGNYGISQGDLDAGMVKNMANAGGAFGTVPVSALPASVTVTALQNPQMSLAKSANPRTYSQKDDLITYTYLVTNTGNVTLAGPILVSDDKTAVTCPTTSSLIPGAAISCSANYRITKADLVAGAVTNIATAHAKLGNNAIDSNRATATVAANIPQLTLACIGGFAPLGKAYSFSLTPTGGVAPYAFSIISGSLPPGLTLNPTTGAITGTPTTSGAFNFTAQVVDYRGNTAGTATSTCGAIYVYQESQFVIWGGNPPIPTGQPANVTIGKDYVFWGAQWWKQVTGGNWTDNASFKGYANQVDLIQKTWTTRPGNSSGPPDSVASYISVIVATMSAKDGSDISGNIAEIVLLKVDDPSAYKPNPGHSGSGVLVAVIR